MLTKNQLMARIAAIVATLADTNGSPESMLYIFFDMNMDLWLKVRTILIEANMIQIKGNYVTLTQSGLETAKRLNQVMTQ